MSLGKLKQIQGLVRSKNWIPSDHLLSYIEEGEFDEGDVERSIATGTIIRIEVDEKKDSVDGKKYLISGTDLHGLAFSTAGKIIEWLNGDCYFVITAFKEKFNGDD